MAVFHDFTAVLLRDERTGAAQRAAWVAVPEEVMRGMRRREYPLGFYVKGHVDRVRYTMLPLEQMPDGSWVFRIPASIIVKAKKQIGDTVRIAMDKDRLSFPMTDAFVVALCKEPKEVTVYYHVSMPPEERNRYNEWMYRARTDAERRVRMERALHGLRHRLCFAEMKRVKCPSIRAERAHSG